jgi:putative ABC transport system permease protein
MELAQAMNQLRLLLRALKWRSGAAGALLVVATVAVLAAAAGPVYLDTANDSVLHSVLRSNSEASNGIAVIPQYEQTSSATNVERAQEVLKAAHRFGIYRWYQKGKMTLDEGVLYPNANYATYSTDLISDPGQCKVLHFVSGGCPTRVDQVAITERTAKAIDTHLGSSVALSAGGGQLKMKVVGIVAVSSPSKPFWFGDDYFDFGPAIACRIGQRCLPLLDGLFTIRASVIGYASVEAIDQFPLRINTVHTTDTPALAASVNTFSAYTNHVLGSPVSTDLGSEISSASKESSLMQSIVIVVDLQLVLLALFVLFGLVARTAETREREVALAKLRGFRIQSVLVVGLLEPIAMLTLALPVGLLLAFVAMRIAQPLLLPGGLVAPQPLVLWAAVVAYAGGIVATLFGARRILTRRLSEELRAVESKSSNVTRAAFDAAALALALAGIIELLTAGVLNGSQPNPVAAFAPGLVAVAVAVVGVRVLPLLCSVVLRRTRNSRWLATGLAVRQVVRRPTSLRQITVLAVATGLACFAVTGWAAAGVNRVTRADFVLGASRVLTVQVPAGVNLVNAVDRADPSGQYAMAVMVSKIPSQNLLAVQASRLRQVAYWPSNISSTTLSKLVKWLTPNQAPPLFFTGKEIRASVTMSGNPSPPPDLVFNLVDSGGNQGVADFGYIREGTYTYTAQLPAACSGGCHVLQLQPLWYSRPTGPQQALYTLSISGLETKGGGGHGWTQSTSRLADPGYWKTSGPISVVHDPAAPATLALRVTDQSSQSTSPYVVPGALPLILHGVVTNANSVSDSAATSVEDFDGTSLTVNVPYQVVALPQLGAEGFLMDLTTATRAEISPPSETVSQVWLAPHTPPRVEGSLKSQGIKVDSVKTPATQINRMNHGGLALAYLFFLFAAGAAAVLAIGAAVFSVFMTSRRRAFELAVLRAIGVPNRTLLRSLLGEQLLVLGPGVILGILAGLLGALMALPSVPEFSSTTGGPPVALVFSPLPIIGMIVVLLILLAAAAGLASAATLRLAGWDRLRMEIT